MIDMKWWLRYRLLKPWLLWNDVWYWFLYRTFRRFDRVKIRSLKPGYYDVDHRLLHASFQLLKDFVEKEKPFEFIDWDHDEGHQNAAREIKSLYHWWTVEYPARTSLVDKVADSKRPKGFEDWSTNSDGTATYGPKEAKLSQMTYPEYHAALRLQWDIEAKWEQEEEENLCRLAKIRRFLWT